ncbi:MAG: itaconate CoA-transferase [Halieaceae bacterium]|jgi:itaconate CoA-transferase
MKPLQGLLVVALEQAVAAPYCSSRLADSGARVIKVERHDGDFARGYDDVVHGESAYFVWLNRGKESICLDIKDATDRNLLQRLCATADVFIQNLAPGVSERHGLGSAALRERNPRLITLDISGYGDRGPYRDMKAYDLLVQCESGLASITGAAAEPGRVGVSVCDIACGMYAHAAILEALIERGITGCGKGLKVSLFDAVADWLNVPLLHQDYGGRAPARVGLNHPSIAPYGAYPCAGGESVVIAVQNEREWAAFCAGVLVTAGLADDPRFVSNVARCEHREALDRVIAEALADLRREEVSDRLRAANIAFGMLNSIADLSAHPQLRRCRIDTPTGPVDLASPPVQQDPPVDGMEATPRVPRLDEHGERIRAEFA